MAHWAEQSGYGDALHLDLPGRIAQAADDKCSRRPMCAQHCRTSGAHRGDIRTRGIVERIRDFVKKRDVQMRAETLSQVIEEAIALTRASVRDRGLRLTVETDPPGVQVEIDKVQVQQVLFNLLRNAIEAMQDQPRRELVVATQPSPGRDGGDQRR